MNNQNPLYKNKLNPIEVRVKDLLDRMTLEEKVAQTLCIYAKKGNFQDEQGNYDEDKAKKLFSTDAGRIAEVGFVENSARKMAELTNKIQKYYLEKTRLGIPVIFHEECLHGQMVQNATCFPQPIALAGTFKISHEKLSLWDAEMNFVVEPGEFEIMIGSSSRDIDLQKLMLNVT